MNLNRENLPSDVWIYKKNKEQSDCDATKHILQQFNAKRLLESDQRILINPNWVHCEHYCEGNTTSTDTLKGITEYLLDECSIMPENIIIGDGGFGSVDPTIKELGVDKLGKDYGVQIRNLDKDDHIVKNTIEPLALESFNIAKTAEDVDVIISVPSLKTHIWAVTTLSMKNLMGLLSNKSIMHSKLHRKIADLTSIYRSKMKFSLIDGFIGSDMMETAGSPVEMNVVLVSEDPIALDSVGSYIIGYGIDKCKYLKYGEKKGLGCAQLEKIQIHGQDIHSIRTKFRR